MCMFERFACWQDAVEAPQAAGATALQLGQLPDGFTRDHGHGQREVKAARGRLHRDDQADIGRLMDRLRHTSRFAAEQQRVSSPEGEVRVGLDGLGGQKHQPASRGGSVLLEGVPIEVAGERRHFEVVHASAPEIAVGEVEPRRFDNVDGQTHAGGEAQDCSGIAGDIRLVEGDAETVVHFHVLFVRGASATRQSWFKRFLDIRVAIGFECVYTPGIVNSNPRRRIWIS